MMYLIQRTNATRLDCAITENPQGGCRWSVTVTGQLHHAEKEPSCWVLTTKLYSILSITKRAKGEMQLSTT